MTLSALKSFQQSKILLPCICKRIPAKSKSVQHLPPIGRQLALLVQLALRIDPQTKPKIADKIRLWYQAIPELLLVLFQQQILFMPRPWLWF